MKKLIVAEKPSVARDIARVLGAKNRGEGYLYGEEYGIQITSTVGVGTMISVVLPWNTEEKGENPDD